MLSRAPIVRAVEGPGLRMPGKVDCVAQTGGKDLLAAAVARLAAHARVLDEAGLGAHRLNACGYSLGPRFSPSWMEDQMFYERAPTVMQPGMVFFLHMILVDSETETAVTLGRTSLVTEAGSARKSRQ